MCKGLLLQAQLTEVALRAKMEKTEALHNNVACGVNKHDSLLVTMAMK